MGKVLITGGLGYIGSHTALTLVKSGWEVILIDNLSNAERDTLQRIEQIAGRKLLFHEADCRDEQAMNAIFAKHTSIEGVIHFAALKAVGESVDKPLLYYDNNVQSLVVLLRVMEKHGVQHLVFSSSCTVYGQPDRIPVTEESPIQKASSPYGYTKQVCEQLIRDAMVANVKLKATLLRYFNPIGAHPSGVLGELPLGVPGNLVPFLTQTAAGLRPALRVFGTDYNTPDGTCVRDYIHIMDLAEAHSQALTWLKANGAANTAVFNLGAGRGYSVMEIIRTFESTTGVKLTWEPAPRRKGDVEAIYADASLAEKQLGWTAKRTLGQALVDAWRWQKQLA